MAQPVVQMTAEQLQSLIESVRTAAVTGIINTTPPTTIQGKGSFTNCTSRFGGQRQQEAVEEFITSIVTYKELETISDADALKGLSLLFYGIASTWWQGVRKEAKTWCDAITLIREHFSPTKPAYQVYLELFERKQDNFTPIDTFICHKRALLAQLPEGRHSEEIELDLIYGLLNIKYRKNILRQDLKTFRELVEKGRVIEQNNLESEVRVPCSQRASKRSHPIDYTEVLHPRKVNRYRFQRNVQNNTNMPQAPPLTTQPLGNAVSSRQ
ncbi:uncharacterized protein LOC101451854 [Ceratitis capitata]|uniref:(Mediterranean fruit fly) hypothetical protein n=1 Tax=Ceratitis capitata TaxID=7213 RepID=A0A811VFZ4_CERCA|nr:uncharacterized protein LOC101451854 [Ceratitis capitata]CAD7013971.1 unnamed protein product [Ceratitis capitata]